MRNRKAMVGWPIIFMMTVAVVSMTLVAMHTTRVNQINIVTTTATEDTANLLVNTLMNLPECFAYEENGRAVGGVIDENKLKEMASRASCVGIGPIVWSMEVEQIIRETRQEKVYCWNELMYATGEFSPPPSNPFDRRAKRSLEEALGFEQLGMYCCAEKRKDEVEREYDVNDILLSIDAMCIEYKDYPEMWEIEDEIKDKCDAACIDLGYETGKSDLVIGKPGLDENVEKNYNCDCKTEGTEFTMGYKETIKQGDLMFYCCQIDGSLKKWSLTPCWAHEESDCSKSCNHVCKGIGYLESDMVGNEEGTAANRYKCKCTENIFGAINPVDDPVLDKPLIIKEKNVLVKNDEGVYNAKMKVGISARTPQITLTNDEYNEFDVTFMSDDYANKWVAEAIIINMTDHSEGCGELTTENIWLEVLGAAYVSPTWKGYNYDEGDDFETNDWEFREEGTCNQNQYVWDTGTSSSPSHSFYLKAGCDNGCAKNCLSRITKTFFVEDVNAMKQFTWKYKIEKGNSENTKFRVYVNDEVVWWQTNSETSVDWQETRATIPPMQYEVINGTGTATPKGETEPLVDIVFEVEYDATTGDNTSSWWIDDLEFIETAFEQRGDKYNYNVFDHNTKLKFKIRNSANKNLEFGGKEKGCGIKFLLYPDINNQNHPSSREVYENVLIKELP